MKPSVELLKDVKLRPIYQSLPSPRDGHSPPLPDFQTLHSYRTYGTFGEEEKNPDWQSPRPYLDVHPNRHMSTLWAVFNSVNSNLGIGYLCVSFAVAQTGIIPGLLALVMITLVSIYTSVLIADCQELSICSSYPDIVEFAYGARGRQLFYGVFYLQEVLEIYFYQRAIFYCFAHLSLAQLSRQLMQIIFPLFINLLTITRFMVLPINIIATSAVFIIYLCIMIATLISIPGVTYSKVLPRVIYTNWSGFAHPIGIMCFALRNCSINLPFLLTNIRRGSSYQVIYRSYSFTTASYSVLAILTIIEFGDTIQHVIVGNLKQPLLYDIVLLAMLITCLMKYSLTLAPLADDASNSIKLSIIRMCGRPMRRGIRRYSDADESPYERGSPFEPNNNNSEVSKGLFTVISILLRIAITLFVWVTNSIGPSLYNLMRIIGNPCAYDN